MSQYPQIRRTLLTLSFMLPLMAAAPADAQSSRALSLKKQGDTHAASGDPAAAELSYQKAIAADPKYRGGYTALSTHYLRQRKYSEAASLLNRAVKRDKGYSEGWYNLAYALRKSGKMKLAIKAYKTFAELDPASADPYFGLGLAYKSLGNYAESARAFRRYTVLERRPDRATWATKANALALEMERMPLATAPEEKAKAPLPRAVPAADGLREEAAALLKEGKTAEAADKFLAVIKENPGDKVSLDALATCLFRLRRYSKAVKVFRAAVKTDPSYNQGWYNLAYAMRKLGRHAKAVSAYNRYINKDPDNADPYFGIALAYKGMGKKKDAARAFELYITKERRPGQDKWIHQARVEIARLTGKSEAEAAAKPAPAMPGLPPVDSAVAVADPAQTPATNKVEDEAARRQREQDMAMMAATTAYTQKSDRKGKGGGKRGGRVLPLVTPAEDRPMAPPVPEEPGGAADTTSEKLRQQGDTLARMGKCREAQPMFIKATKLDPFNVTAFNGLAYCAYQLGQYDEGISALRVAMRDNPRYPLGWLHKARLERAAKKNISAVGSYRRYLGGNMPIPDAHFELARTLRDLKMNDQAVVAYGAYLSAENRSFAASQVLAAHQEMTALGGKPPATRITMPGDGGRTVTVSEYIEGRKRQSAAKDEDLKATNAKADRAAKIAARKDAKARKAAEAKAAREAKRQAKVDAKARKADEAKAAREAKIQAREDAKAAREAERQAKKDAKAAREFEAKVPTDSSDSYSPAGGKVDSLEVARAVSGDITTGGTLPFPAPEPPAGMYRSASEASKGLVRMADREFSKRHLVVALGLYEQAAKLDPSSSEALYKGGATAMALGQMDQAAAFYRNLLRLNSNDEAARYNLELCRRSAREKAASASQVKSRSARVEAMLAAKQYAAAVKAATTLLGMSPTAEVYLLRGQARLGSGDLSGSLNDGGRALSLNPDLPGAIRLLGDAHSRAGKSKKALFYYRLFLARTPVNSSTARQRAEVLRMIKGL